MNLWYKLFLNNTGDQKVISELEILIGNAIKYSEDSIYSVSNYGIDSKGNINRLNLCRVKIDNSEVFFSLLLKLTRLSNLNIYYCNIADTTPFKDIKKLINLTWLWIMNCDLVDISPLNQLTNLRTLNLSGNKIDDITPLQALTNLISLRLNKNQIIDISPLKNLINLSNLHLEENKIIDISPLKELKEINDIDLSSNLIEDLPYWITEFVADVNWNENFIRGINLYNNPLKSPPPEIVQQGKEAIKNYFEQLNEQEQGYLFEAKLLILGEPGAGKTTMAWKIENSNCNLPKEENTTRGIDVRHYSFSLHKEDLPSFPHLEKLENKQFFLNIWDFGGQEIYKATHRFFLNTRSMFALVADSRNEDTDFNYWLHIVEIFGGDSPLLIVLNEKHQRKRNIDVSAMRERFTNIKEVLEVDFAEEDKGNLEKLKRSIRYYVSQLPHVGSPVPSNWTKVRKSLNNDNRNIITREEYLNVCRTNGISNTKDALVLSQYFHDIGVFLHFQEDSLLKNILFLKPNWATSAVYKILDHPLLNAKNGKFNRKDAQQIWHDEEYMFIIDELLRLMQKFFLTYEIENTEEYIVPERLQPEQPSYQWDDKYNLLLRYEYDFFMPKGILSQFIVQVNRFINNHNLVWKRGVVLERENTTAEIIESYDARSIKIRVAGKNRRDFMTIIVDELDKINSQYSKLKVEKLIPCNCGECKVDENPHFYKFRDLKRRIEKGRFDVECNKSYLNVSVQELIDEVINKSLIKTSEMNSSVENIHDKEKKRDKVFVSYSHKDIDMLGKVQTHLKVLENEGLSVNLWDDTKIKAGLKWKEEIEKALAESKVAILFVSTDFMASDFITKYELPSLLMAAEKEGAIILPLILKPCRFSKHKELSVFQAVNDPSKPLSSLSEHEQDTILVKLADRIEEILAGDN